MSDERIIFQVASAIHAHQWINAAEIEVTFGNLGPEGHHFSECLVCPDCGRLWSRIVRSTQKPQRWAVDLARCREHGGSLFDRLAWTIADPRILADLSPRTMEFILDQYHDATRHAVADVARL